ncbi:MAG: ATP-dependent helicase HrpB [Actinomycetota bacterium]
MTERVPLTDLPIEACVDDVRAALATADRCVVTAEPGAGKTTILPLRLLDEPWLEDQTIILLEPRRMAARAAARRLARLLGEDTGETVGWITRDDRAVGPATRLLVVTEGVLTARLVDDPALTDIGLVIFDEFHERSVPGDVGLALLLAGRRAGEHDARMLVMSATIDADTVAAHLDGAPIVTSPGRTHPIEIVWRPKKRRDPLAPAVARAVREALKGPGDVLVFLPGVGEIRSVERELVAALGPDGPTVLPLHGSLPAAEQDAALVARAGRRVVLATNIAETSLTVDGITAVVDAGLERTARLDPRTGMSGLHTIACSRASADQRAGRAGRLGPGIAIRLWSKAEHAARKPHAPPNIVDDDMAPVVLDLARRGITDPASIPFLTPPEPARWRQAVELLSTLGALDDDGAATVRGHTMAALPVHPRLARMIVEARHPWLACVAAAVLDERDVLRGRPADLPVELVDRVRLIVDPDDGHEAADGRAIRGVRERARQLARRAGIEAGLGPGDVDLTALGATIAAGFPDRIARRIGSTRGGFVTADGRSLSIDKRHPLHEAAGIVAVDVDARSKRGAVHRAARLEARLDHLVYATPDLAATVDRITREWGVTPTPGGRHDGQGTANALLAIGGGAYLEIIGPDPDQPDPDGPRPFHVDQVTEPRLVTWAAAVPDLDLWMRWCAARKIDPGPAFAMQRTTPEGTVLRWRLTPPPEVGDGIVPFLIEWPGPTPAATAATGVELFALELTHPDPAIAGRLQEYGLPHPVARSAPSLSATLFTPAGMVTLGS